MPLVLWLGLGYLFLGGSTNDPDRDLFSTPWLIILVLLFIFFVSR